MKKKDLHDAPELQLLDTIINVLLVVILGLWMIWSTAQGAWGSKDSWIVPLIFAFSAGRLVYLFKIGTLLRGRPGTFLWWGKDDGP